MRQHNAPFVRKTGCDTQTGPEGTLIEVEVRVAFSTRFQSSWRGVGCAAVVFCRAPYRCYQQTSSSRTRSPPRVQARKQVGPLSGCENRPSVGAIRRLVDYHIAHSGAEAEPGRAFDVEELKEQLQGRWSLGWIKTYSYMGLVSRGRLGPGWTGCEDLAGRFPTDSRQFCAVWRRG